MSDDNENEEGSNWKILVFLLVALPLAFGYGGVWVGLVVFLIGSVVIGWEKRHEGPFPTNRRNED